MDFPHRIRDPIHGFIRFSNNERKIIDSPCFLRLRGIRQLALTNYVYPGATHTRFEHSLGVMELATRFFDELIKNDELIQNTLQGAALSSDEARCLLRGAALLHDVGHLPFSHGGEEMLPSGKKHEDVSIAIISSMESMLDDLLFCGATKAIIQLIDNKPILPALLFLKNILSGSIDADRMDYLLRDSHHCGVEYGKFDYVRLLETLRIDRSGGGTALSLDHGGIHSIEALLLARYYMFTQVYYHRTRRIYDYYLKQYMRAWNPFQGDLLNIMQYDDADLLTSIKKDAQNPDHPAYQYAKRICDRHHHSIVFQTGEFADAREERRARSLYEELEEAHPDYDFILDNPTGTIHKFFVPGQPDAGDEFQVVQDGKKKLLTEWSKIICNMPKQFKSIRIYVDQKEPSVLNSLKQEVGEFERRMLV